MLSAPPRKEAMEHSLSVVPGYDNDHMQAPTPQETWNVTFHENLGSHANALQNVVPLLAAARVNQVDRVD